MPELPEVETVVRDLRPMLVGRAIRRVETSRLAMRRGAPSTFAKSLVGRTATAVERRGKWILINLDGPWLLVHLGMTGQFTVVPSEAARQDHTHFVGSLEGDFELRFRDVRRFGSMTLHATRATLDAALGALGPEPIDLQPDLWRASLRKTKRNLKACLLDQRLVAGVGNIYADESLHLAGLRPTRTGDRLTAIEAERLRAAIVAVLTKAIDHRGSTIKDYVGGSGLMGGYQDEFRVYGRGGEPCPKCDRPITRIVLAGRSTHYCTSCQK